MEENYIKNIITISGEPASGKGSVVSLLKDYYEKQGLEVYVISVGNMFRDIAIEEYKKIHPEIENPSIEQANNDPDFASKRAQIDEQLDSYIAKKGKEITEANEQGKIYIFDSRLAFSNIPNSFSIRLTVDEKVAGERVFNDSTRGKEDTYGTLEEAIAITRKRKEGEISRYIERYGVDLTDESQYNLVIDTSMAKLDDIIEVITKSFELDKNGKEYSKMWRSPQWFLPLQDIMDTGGAGDLGLDSNQFEKMIKKDGYRYDCPITAIQVDGYYYIIEGHHRNFVMGYMGKTLIPYQIIGKDDEIMQGYKSTARERVYPLLREDRRKYYLSTIYDHEECFPDVVKDGEERPYYYTDIYGAYPEIKVAKKDDRSNQER